MARNAYDTLAYDRAHLSELRTSIDTRFRGTLRNERLVVYDLREGL